MLKERQLRTASHEEQRLAVNDQRTGYHINQATSGRIYVPRVSLVNLMVGWH